MFYVSEGGQFPGGMMGRRDGPEGHGSRWLASSTGNWKFRRQDTDGSEVGGLEQNGGPGEDGVFGFSSFLGDKPGWLGVGRQVRMPGQEMGRDRQSRRRFRPVGKLGQRGWQDRQSCGRTRCDSNLVVLFSRSTQ